MKISTERAKSSDFKIIFMINKIFFYIKIAIYNANVCARDCGPYEVKNAHRQSEFFYEL